MQSSKPTTRIAAIQSVQPLDRRAGLVAVLGTSRPRRRGRRLEHASLFD